jgi:hypothetical protein
MSHGWLSSLNHNAGETGVEGAAVNLEAPNGDATRSLGQRITNSLGEFAFGRLDPGEYTVSVGSSPQRKIEAQSTSVTISGVETQTVDIGVKVLSGLMHPPMKVKGTVFFDANRNGLRDKGERVLRGVAAFVDVNGNGKRDSNEPITRSSAGGRFSLLAPDRKFQLKFLLPRRYHLQGLFNRSFQIDATAAQDPVEYELGVTGRK